MIREGLAAGAVAGALSGTPSTLHAVVTGRGPLDATRAAGRLLAPDAEGATLLGAAAAVHAVLSLGWGVVLSAALPRRREIAGGALAGLAIAGLDLGVVARSTGDRAGRGDRRRTGAVGRLPTLPQVADHVAFGVIAGAVLRRARGGGTGARPG